LGDVSVPQYELSYKRLGDYIERLKADGYDARDYQMAQAQRLAYPFAAFIMVLMAIPHGLTPPRSHNLSKGIAISLGLALGFWLLYSLSVALGRAGLMPPLAAAWLPLAICAAYGTNRLLAVKQ
jgi:lipopolysaccharide export system permease protein